MSRKPRPCAVCHKFDHGRCKKERTAFKCYHIKECFVEVEKS